LRALRSSLSVRSAALGARAVGGGLPAGLRGVGVRARRGVGGLARVGVGRRASVSAASSRATAVLRGAALSALGVGVLRGVGAGALLGVSVMDARASCLHAACARISADALHARARHTQHAHHAWIVRRQAISYGERVQKGL
jgi:hypothetical protein